MSKYIKDIRKVVKKLREDYRSTDESLRQGWVDIHLGKKPKSISDRYNERYWNR